MPLYEFRCPECGHRFEVLSSFERAQQTVCPECGAKAERVYEGSCAFGKRATSDGHGCSGSCAHCGGCHRR